MPKPPDNLITIYGRKPVLEALQQPELDIYRVHLADSNKSSPIIADIEAMCRQRQIECRYHDRLTLSRISKNRKQDQGVAADILNPRAQRFEAFLQPGSSNVRLMALDRITNPQNLGMIIRSVTASGMDGLLMPKRGCAKLDSLVVKASAGTVFRGRLLFCEDLADALRAAKIQGFTIYGMALTGAAPLPETKIPGRSIIVLGNESDGLSQAVRQLCDELVYIPLQNGVESLNVSVAAGIVAFQAKLAQ